jgi:hypothetical protein
LPLFGLIAVPARAICPVCVIAVGAGLGLSEYLGIDDTIAGLWIGGLLVSMIIWTIDWIERKDYKLGNKDLRDITITVLYYGLTFWPLWAKNLIGHPSNRLWGVDKLILGTIFGSLLFLAAASWYKKIKKRLGHAQFPFQKVAMPVGALLLGSLAFYLLTK